MRRDASVYRARLLRRPRGAPRLGLSDAFRAWLADNLLRGVSAEDLAGVLAARGVPEALARRELAALAASPALQAARARAGRLARVELVAELARRVAALSAHAVEVERRPAPAGDEFFERYYCTNTPVVVTGLLEGWPALSRWSPAYFKERFGDAEIEITAARDGDPDYDRNFRAHARTVRFADFADMLLATGETNDFYMVANNRNLERPALRALLDDIVIPGAYLEPDRIDGCACLWIGPAGTVTPLHHDTSNILFCQVLGRKRVRLISPLETSLLDGIDGVYSPIDAERPDLERHPAFRDVQVKVVEIGPGDALFLPVGWWHHVRALTPSATVSFTGFRRPNQFDWYVPGSLG